MFAEEPKLWLLVSAASSAEAVTAPLMQNAAAEARVAVDAITASVIFNLISSYIRLGDRPSCLLACDASH
jgi:hypothetical protein